MTQAAIRHQVKGLEDRPGVSLFRRSNRGVQLTDEGVALAPFGIPDGAGRILETVVR